MNKILLTIASLHIPLAGICIAGLLGPSPAEWHAAAFQISGQMLALAFGAWLLRERRS